MWGMNLNKAFLIGRLTADPQLRATTTGQSVGSFSIATNRNWTDKNGAKQEDTQFHNIVVWGKQAELVNQFLKKGSEVFIEGRIQTRSWQDQQGQNRKSTEVVAERVQFGARPFGAVQSRPFGTDVVNGAKPAYPTSEASANNQQFASRGNSSQPMQSPAKEELPEINLEEGEMKAEEIPF